MIIKGAIYHGSTEHLAICRYAAVEKLTMREIVKVIKALGGSVSMNTLSAIRRDTPNTCESCNAEFFCSGYASKTCSLRCRDIARRYRARGQSIPAELARPVKRPDTASLKQTKATANKSHIPFGHTLYIDILQRHFIREDNLKDIQKWLVSKGYIVTVRHIQEVLNNDPTNCVICNDLMYQSKTRTTCDSTCAAKLRIKNNEAKIKKSGLELREHLQRKALSDL